MYSLYKSNIKQFDRYAELLLKWNKKINLTSITERDEIRVRHFLDSLSLAPQIVSRETILDIGSGAGFPGLPLKIVFPGIKLTVVDAIKKKCDFIKAVVRDLGIDGVEVVNQRLKPGDHFGDYDAIVSRATLRLLDFVILASPNLKQGGRMLLMKGPDPSAEIQEASEEIRRLGLMGVESFSYNIEGKFRGTILVTGR